MGLLKYLLGWPVTGPAFLARYSMEKVEEMVRQELTDDSRIKNELLELQLELEMEEISDEEYLRREADLMTQLRDVRAWREEFGMANPSGLVRVARDQAEPPPPRDE
jgi:hypothetical protein